MAQILSQVSASGSSVPGVKIYRALLTQSGTSNPTAVVLENTLGAAIDWVRLDVGSYEGQLAGAFTFQKTFLMVNPVTGADNPDLVSFSLNTTDAVTIITGQSPSLADGVLNLTAVEIIVYP